LVVDEHVFGLQPSQGRLCTVFEALSKVPARIEKAGQHSDQERHEDQDLVSKTINRACCQLVLGDGHG